MGPNRRMLTRLLGLVILGVLLCAAFLSGTFQAQAGLPASLPPASGDTTGKVEAQVLRDTANGQRTSFVVLLSEQADLSAAYGMKDQDARGWYVYNTLRDTAAKTQGPIRAAITAAGETYQAFWVANMIVASGDRNLVLSLAARPDVRLIESNRPFKGIDDPVTTPISEPSVPNTIEWGVQNVNAPAVWALGYTGQGMVVANQDTGMRWTQVALKPKYRGWNGTSADHNYNWWDAIHDSPNNPCGNNSQQPCDDYGHGTHTTGTIVGDDGTGDQIGVAPGAKWIGCHDMDQNVGTPARYSECFQFFIAPTDLNGQNPNPALRPDVMNNSWECPPSEGCAQNTLEVIVNNTQAAGIFVEASAQNSGPGCSTVQNPVAIYSAAFSTGAIDVSNTLASFSSRGPSTYYTPNLLKPNISAPGVNVRSSYNSSDTSFTTLSGTSMAGPHVVGVVALIWSARPALVRDITGTKQLLQNTANPNVVAPAQTCGGIPSSQIPNNSFGYGRVDALAAYNASGGGTPTPTASATPIDLVPAMTFAGGYLCTGGYNGHFMLTTQNTFNTHVPVTSTMRLYGRGGTSMDFTVPPFTGSYTYQYNCDGAVPCPFAPSVYTLTVDVNNVVVETNENNNSMSQLFSLGPTVTPCFSATRVTASPTRLTSTPTATMPTVTGTPVDLVPQFDFQYSSSCSGGGYARFNLTTANTYNTTVPVTSTMRFYGPNNTSMDVPVPPFTGSYTYQYNCNGPIPCLQYPLVYTLTVDINNVVVETDETNNTLVRMIPLPPTTTPCPPTATPSYTVTGTTSPTRTTTTPTASATCQSYSYALSTGTMISATHDIGNHCDICATTIDLPFPVSLYDQTFTTAQAGSKGYLAFGTAYEPFDVRCLPFSGATYVMAPFWVDQYTAVGSSGCTSCGIFTETLGTAPNRTFIVEYRTLYFNQHLPDPTLDYEIQLQEGQSAYKYVYGTVTSYAYTDSALTIGVQKSVASNVYTSYYCDPTGHTAPDLAGRQLTWTYSSCSTITPSPSPTGTAVDLVPQFYLGGGYSCTQPYFTQYFILTTQNTFNSSVPVTSTMRFYGPNNTSMDVAVPPFSGSYNYRYDCDGTVPCPGQFGQGVYTLTVDINNVVVETNESNNTLAQTIYPPPTIVPCTPTPSVTGTPGTATPTVTGTPVDLVPQFTLGGGYSCHDPFTQYFTLRTLNNYYTSVPVTSTMRFYGPGNTSMDVTVPPFTGSYSYQYNCNGTVPCPGQFGQGVYTLTVDVNNVVVETDESNNTETMTVYAPPTVTPCPFESPTPPNTPTATATRTAAPSATACPMSFVDVHTTDWFYNYVLWLYCNNIISGYHTSPPCGAQGEACFKPNNPTTRSQDAKITVLVFRLPIDTSDGPHFQDVPPGNGFYPYVETLFHKNAVSGYPCGRPGEPCIPPNNLPYFRPYSDVTRGQLSKIFVMGGSIPIDISGGLHFQDVPVSNDFFPFIETLFHVGAVHGYPCGTPPAGACVPPDNLPYFRPNNNITRAQISQVAYISRPTAVPRR